MQSDKCREIPGPSYVEVLQIKIANLRLQYPGIELNTLFSDYLIAKEMLGKPCPICNRNLAKNVDNACLHIKRHHFSYYQIMLYKLLDKEIEYAIRHSAERHTSEYYDKLPNIMNPRAIIGYGKKA